MIKDIEWLKEEIEEDIKSWGGGNPDYFRGASDAYENVLELINQLDEPEVLSQELPVIPKFVADWIEEVKKQNKSMVFAITYIYDKNEIGKTPKKKENRIFQWMELDDNEEVFARAWLGGYQMTEEQEQKYYVDLGSAAYVAKWDGNDQVDIYTDGISGSDEYELHLTEQEIKDYDERFWPFAVKVEELEE